MRRHEKRRPRCANGCGREVKGGAVCGPCRLARREGYFLSPAPAPDEIPNDKGREARIMRYAALAAQGLSLFD